MTDQTALSVAGHWGEWLQGRMGTDGPVVLVTLPCRALWVRPSATTSAAPTLYSENQLGTFRTLLDLPEGEWPRLESNITPGCGAGASTATLVALARGIGFDGDPDQLARACLAIEGASDPLMYCAPDRLLWASREARIIRHLPTPPAAVICAGYWGAAERTNPADEDFADVSDLLTPWENAADQGDLMRLAALASEFAARCTARRGPADPLETLARDLGALGMIRAHTGSARGLVFAPGDVSQHARAALQEAGLRDVFQFNSGRS